MTLKMLVSDIRNIASSGSNPIDFRIEDAQIIFWINECRSKLIAQAIQKRQDISTTWTQTIACLDLEQGDISDCCNTTTGCNILQSVLTLPRSIETGGEDGIIRVETLTGKIIPRGSAFSDKYHQYSKYTGDKVTWRLKDNDKLIIEGSDFLTKVAVVGIWEDPRELAAYSDCSGGTCYSSTSNYPCSTKMASDITDIVLKTKVFPFLQLPQDTTNDAADRPDAPINTRGL